MVAGQDPADAGIVGPHHAVVVLVGLEASVGRPLVLEVDVEGSDSADSGHEGGNAGLWNGAPGLLEIGAAELLHLRQPKELVSFDERLRRSLKERKLDENI